VNGIRLHSIQLLFLQPRKPQFFQWKEICSAHGKKESIVGICRKLFNAAFITSALFTSAASNDLMRFHRENHYAN
jgi:hypothetical protein